MGDLNSLVGQTSGGLPDRLASIGKVDDANMDLVNQLVELQSKQDKLNQQEAALPTMKDKLLSVPGLLAMLGSGAAAAGGDPNAAGGLLQGFMGGSESQIAQSQAQIAQSREATTKAIDAQRQRLTTMLTSRPDMFIDPKTGESLVDPRLLGYAATGYMLPINPATNYTLTKQDNRTKTLVEMGTNLMLNGETPAQRTRGATMISNALNLGLDQEFFDVIAEQDETAAWQTLLARPGLDTSHVLDAWLYSVQNNLPLSSPEIIGMLRPSKEMGADGSKLTINDRVLQLVGQYSSRIGMIDPDLYNQMSLEERIDAVFSQEEAGDAALLKHHFLGDDAFGTGVSGGQMLNMMQRIGEIQVMMFQMNPDAKFFKDRGITSAEQIWDNIGTQMVSAVSYVQQAGVDAAGASLGTAHRRIAEFLYGQDSTLGSDALFSTTAAVLKELKDGATDPTTNRFDQKKFDVLLNEYLKGVQ